MNLKERAAAADADKRQVERNRAKEQRQKDLDATIARWPNAYCIGSKLDVPCPPREDFTFVRDIPHDGGGRDKTIFGWQVEIDGISFVTNGGHYSSSGDWVLVTCPDCNTTHACDFFDVADLGKILKAGRHFLHRCLEIETRELAYALGRAARETGLTVEQVVEETRSRHWELVGRICQR
jgi:hypothetical protein